MKKTITFFGSALLTFGAAGLYGQDQLPNNSFENWVEIEIRDSLDFWNTTNASFFPYDPSVSKIETGVDGKAVLLENVEIPEEEELFSGGIILSAELSDDGELPMGYPYDSEVDNFNAYLRFDIAPLDTAFVLVILESEGIPFSFLNVPIIGAQPTWELFSWDLDDAFIAPDAVTIAFFSSGYGESVPLEGSWMEVDSVFFGNSGETPEPLPNFSFEDWTTVSIDACVDWYSFDPLVAGVLGINNIYQSTDAVEGDFSMLIETNEINLEEEIIPFISNGEFDFISEELEGGTPYTSDPLLFKGQYKFLSEADDTAYVYMIFSTDAGDIEEYSDTLYPTEDWEEFSFDIDLEFTPDSVLAAFFGGQLADAQIFYDDFRFVYSDVSISENQPPLFNAYPNPASDFVKINLIESADIVITDLTGKIMFSAVEPNNSLEISTANWAPGIYLIQVIDGANFETKQLIITH